MWKNLRLINLVFLTWIWTGHSQAITCGGSFPDPITDVCWLCMFPMRVGPAPIEAPPQRDPVTDVPPPLLCACPAPPPTFIRPGVGISFWEPARVAEVVRTPLCSPTLDGAILGSLSVPAGTNTNPGDRKGGAFYHFHWFQYPLLSWVGMAFTSGACMTNETFDLAYLSEFDPLWDDDELSFLLNPEAVLFTNPVTQAACVADTTSAALTDFGLDPLFWCSGTGGSVYPLDGSQANHVGGIDSSLAIVHKGVFRLHRSLLAQDTSTLMAMCMTMPQPLMRKNQYKQQMMYPVPQNTHGYGLGAPSVIWGAGREFPYSGEDFSYLVWRKRTCCAF